MKLNYIKSQSSVYPELVDTTSSKKVVYLRQNVVEVTTTDEFSGETYVYYEYDEAKLTKDEYPQYLKELSSTETLKEIENLKTQISELEERVATSDAMYEAILEGVNNV